MSPREAGPVPRLPGPDLPAGFIWPAATGRSILRKVPRDEAVSRDDLVGRQNLADGSGTSDVLLLQAGDWCLKTSLRRRFTDLDAGRTALLELVRRKSLLGNLLPRETVLALASDEEARTSGGAEPEAWLWTVCPWLPSLRRQMAGAVERGDEAGLASALAAYAAAAIEGMALAARRQAQLDIHPSNFALTADGIWYVDDDIGTGSVLPAIGHALLQRVEEYGRWERAVDVYLSALEEALPAHLSAEDAQAIGLAEAVDQTVVRSSGAEAARQRLRRAIWRCRPAP